MVETSSKCLGIVLVRTSFAQLSSVLHLYEHCAVDNGASDFIGPFIVVSQDVEPLTPTEAVFDLSKQLLVGSTRFSQE